MAEQQRRLLPNVGFLQRILANTVKFNARMSLRKGCFFVHASILINASSFLSIALIQFFKYSGLMAQIFIIINPVGLQIFA